MQGLLQQVQPRMLMLLLGSIVALTALGAYLYLFKKDLKELQQLNRMYRQSVKAVSIQEQALNEFDMEQLQNQVIALKSQLYGKRANMLPGELVSHIIGELDMVAARNNVRLISVKPGARAELLDFEEVPFDVEVRGGYFELYNWLQGAEQELRPMVVKQFHLIPSSPGDEVRMEVRMVSYRPQERP